MSHMVTTDTTSFIAITLIELPSAVVLVLLMDIWGRKPLMVKLQKNLSSAFGNLQYTQLQRLLPWSCLAFPALLLAFLRRFSIFTQKKD